MPQKTTQNSNPLKQDILLAEYNAICDRIKSLQDDRLRILIYTLTGWIVALGAADKLHINQSLIPVMLIAILIIGFEKYYGNINQFFKYGSYIHVFYENRIFDLKWETANQAFGREKNKNLSTLRKIIRLIFNILSNELVWPYLATIYFIVIYSQSIFALWNPFQIIFYYTILFIGSIIIVNNIRGIFWLSYKGYSEYISIWKKIKDQLCTLPEK